MNISVGLHGPHQFTARVVTENATGRLVAFNVTTPGEPGVCGIFLHTRAEADDLVRAALAARDLLNEGGQS